MSALRMPSLGADMKAGTVLEWHVAPGDAIHRGDIVASVDTDKAEIEIESFEDGVIEELLVQPGTKVPVGTDIARLRSDGAEAAKPRPAPAPPPPLGPESRDIRGFRGPGAAAVHHARVSPLARRLAVERGVDPEALTGTGPGGAVTRADVERAAGAPPGPAAPAAERRPATDRQASLRTAIGELMARSKREIPHYHLSQLVDMTAALAWLDAANATRAPRERLLPAALLLKAAALAAREVPELNGTFTDGAFIPAGSVHLGVAISLRGGGVIAPAIRDAHALTPDELMAALREMIARTRRGVLRSSDVAGGTLTVTSLGEQGVDSVQGVIFPPQVALVGFGRIAERPWAAGGMVGARPTVIATLAADHRVSDGHRGGVYLATVDHRLQEPEKL